MRPTSVRIASDCIGTEPAIAKPAQTLTFTVNVN